MNIICLLENPEAVIASGKRVFSAAETGALLSMAESADRLQASVQEEEDRIQQAEKQACEKAREEGIAQGRQIAADELAQTKLGLLEQANAERLALREEVLSHALQVVRKIADGIASEDMLYALANTASQECLPSASIVLKVHPTQVDALKQKLSEYHSNNDTPHLIQSVAADEDLALDGCILQTDAGRVCADLDMQLSVLEKHLAESGLLSGAVAASETAATTAPVGTAEATDTSVLAESNQ